MAVDFFFFFSVQPLLNLKYLNLTDDAFKGMFNMNENTTAKSFHSPITKRSIQILSLILAELLTELSPVLRTRRSCRLFSFFFYWTRNMI